MRARNVVAASAAGIVACVAGTTCIIPADQCQFHCWESSVTQDELPEDPERPGYFSMQCGDADGASVFVPIPSNGFGARACYTGSTGPLDYPGPAENSLTHALLKLAVYNLDNGVALTPDQQDAYNKWKQALGDAVFDTCVAALSCSGKPGTCDIDPAHPGSQSCTVTSAENLCVSLVADELEGQLALPSPTKLPECSGTDFLPVYANLDACDDFVPDMTGFTCENFTPTGGEDDGGVDDAPIDPTSGADDESGSDTSGSNGGADSTGGADETGGADDESGSSTSAGAAPFGDVGMMIDCTGNDCIVSPDLVDNLYADFGVFYDEGVVLELVDATTACGPGIRFGGIAPSSATADLARPFGVDNGDVVRRLNGLAITDTDDILAALDMIATESTFTVHVSERVGSGCRTRVLTVDVDG